MRTIKEWQVEAHRLATEKGFHSRECDLCKNHPWLSCQDCNLTGRVPVDPHSPTRIASRLALIHCEISEAVECVAHGRMELYFDRSARHILGHDTHYMPKDMWDAREQALVYHYKPEGFPIELADVFLRLCDLAESLGVEIPELGPSAKVSDCETPEEIAAELAYLHKLAVRIGTNPFNAPNYGALYAQLHFLMAWTSPGVDLLAMAELKHEFDRTRPIMHGGKVL